MPTYNFECDDCGLAFELKRPMSQAGDPATCPQDGANAHRLYSAAAVQRPSQRRSPSHDPDVRAERAQTADERGDAAGVPRAPDRSNDIPLPDPPSR